MNVRIHPLFACLFACVALAACQREPAAVAPVAPAQDAAAAQADATLPPNNDQPATDVPPATAPPGTLPPRLQQGGQALARWDGYGDVRLGMDAEQVRKGWGWTAGRRAAGRSGGLLYLRPKWALEDLSFGFMFEGGKLVRYESDNPKELAPGAAASACLRRISPRSMPAMSKRYRTNTKKAPNICASPRPAAGGVGVRNRHQRQGHELARGPAAAGGLRRRLLVSSRPLVRRAWRRHNRRVH